MEAAGFTTEPTSSKATRFLFLASQLQSSKTRVSSLECGRSHRPAFSTLCSFGTELADHEIDLLIEHEYGYYPCILLFLELVIDVFQALTTGHTRYKNAKDRYHMCTHLRSLNQVSESGSDPIENQ